MSNYILSKRLTTEIDPEGPTATHRLRVWVSEASNNLPAEIFVYQKIPPVPKTEEAQLEEIFVHIASYADILDFPVDCPSEETPFFRLHYIDLSFTSLALLDEKWSMMKKMINHTVEDIVRLNNLPAVSLEELDVT
jgi:hypothetical protein